MSRRFYGAGRIASGILLLVAIVWLTRRIHAGDILVNALDAIRAWGPWAPLLYFLVYVLATVCFVPGSVLTLGAGVLFGVIKGSVLVSISATAGATCAFLAGRYFARGWISKKTDQNPKFRAVDEAVGREGWKIVLLTRLSPVFPFNLLNYAFGLTKVKLRGYFWASWIGMIPGTVLYVYIGSLIGDLALIGREGRNRTALEWVFYGLGLLAAAAVTMYVTHLAKKALKERMPEPVSK